MYALELYEAMQTLGEFEAIFLARIGSDVLTQRRPHPGTPFSSVDGDPNQYFFFTETAQFDSFYMTLRDKDAYTIHFNEFLLAHQPDVVHFQHTHYLGFDLIRQTKNTLPNAIIVYTLHEYMPICHHHGYMIRTPSQKQELCHRASPRRCHECFPEISPQAFFMRQRFIQSHFSLVDRFLAPSHFLLERYVEWGIPKEKISFMENGRRLVRRSPGAEARQPRNRLGFFGQFSYFKGVHIVLEAMKILGQEECRAHLWLHGANIELQSEKFQSSFKALVEASEENVSLVGRYDHTALARLMANIDWVVVPSVWWENSPLVIQEAFFYGRPVICGDVGGMAEKVVDGKNGLHFRIGDPESLAQTIRQAVSSPDLWEKLHKGITKVQDVEDSAKELTRIYRATLERSGVEA